jgi:threonine/homoserine/homoserine lactone efflux protein
MVSIDTMGAGTTLGLGAALAALNPKNLPLALSAGLSLAQVGDTAEEVTGLILFVLLAGSSVLAPVVVYLLLAGRIAGPLAATKDWLAHNNAAVMFVVLLIFGVTLVAKGIGGLTS